MVMKTFFITIGIIIIIVASLLAFVSKKTQETEQQEYEVLKEYEGFEIRRYAPALFSSVKLEGDSYKSVSSQGFRTLAGYIFGGNETEEKIAMTSPVTMEISDTSKMMFLVPKALDKDSLPKPNNSDVYFEEYPERIVAAIVFGGWANDDKIEKHTKQLIQLLEAEGIEYTNKFSFLGYNPPYEVVNRRNEIIVEVNWKSK